MSRIGRQSIIIPEKVKVTVSGSVVTVEGPLGTLSQTIDTADINVKVDAGAVHVTRANEDKVTKSKHGLYRVLIANMVKGVTAHFTRSLIVNGVGYKCAINGGKLVMNIGFSHQVEVVPPKGIELICTTPTDITVKGIDKQMVGQIAASIKAKKPVEPYHLYGIRYSDEVVVKKEGKTGGK